ncbi:UNVERIFIED_ORG: type IV secretion system protein VirB7 [Shinella zoogloeoides]|nr:type IV secretion system protein VirB7 [Shinella zoogloeoides]
MISPNSSMMMPSQMIRLSLLLAMATVFGSCASLTDPLPRCDGYSRRPLNRSMWEWEGYRSLQSSHSETRSLTSIVPYTAERQGLEPFAHLDVEGSHGPCVG